MRKLNNLLQRSITPLSPYLYFLDLDDRYEANISGQCPRYGVYWSRRRLRFGNSRVVGMSYQQVRYPH